MPTGHVADRRRAITINVHAPQREVVAGIGENELRRVQADVVLQDSGCVGNGHRRRAVRVGTIELAGADERDYAVLQACIEVVAAIRELPLIGAVGAHDPDVAAAAEHNPAACVHRRYDEIVEISRNVCPSKSDRAARCAGACGSQPRVRVPDHLAGDGLSDRRRPKAVPLPERVGEGIGLLRLSGHTQCQKRSAVLEQRAPGVVLGHAVVDCSLVADHQLCVRGRVAAE